MGKRTLREGSRGRGLGGVKGETMQTKTLYLREIVPYENNPRKNDSAVDAVAESIGKL